MLVPAKKKSNSSMQPDAVVARLDDSDSHVRRVAWETLAKLEPATLAQHAEAVVARLQDSVLDVRYWALTALAKLEPATLAQYAEAVVTRLEDSVWDVSEAALKTLGKLDPATLVQYAGVVVARLEDPSRQVRRVAYHTLEMLPRYVRYAIRGVDCKELQSRALNHGQVEELRSRLLGRIEWYRCRIRLRVRSLSLYWYALPYHPSGPGHARDVEAWNHMIEE